MTSVLGNVTKLAEYISECTSLGIKVLPPDINKSSMYFHPDGNNIIFGLLALKNVGKQFVENLIRERKQRVFSDFEEFVRRMSDYDLNKRMVEGLIKSGAFDSLGVYRSRLLASYERLIDIRAEKNRNNISGQLDMFSVAVEDESTSAVPRFEYPALPDFLLKDKLMLEKESSGMYFSGHMIDSYSEQIASLGVTNIADLLGDADLKEKQGVRICGIITSVNTKITKKNEKMAFVRLEDRYGEIETIIFPKVYAQSCQNIRIDAAVFVDGTVSLKEDEPPRVLANFVEALADNAVMAKRKAILSETPVKPTAKAPAPASKLYLRVPSLTCKEYLKAKNIVDIFDGSVKVIFYDRETSSYSNYPSGISATKYILSELQEILGNENVVLK
jgi:DNA polymerase-3 subunit alpha